MSNPRNINHYVNGPAKIFLKKIRYQWRIRWGGGAPDAPNPPTAQNFLNLTQFFGKFGKIICCHPPPRGLAPPPMGNPESTPGYVLPLSKDLFQTLLIIGGYKVAPGTSPRSNFFHFHAVFAI